MSYFKQFDEWNNRYPEFSVKAEQYTYIKSLLQHADQDKEKMDKQLAYYVDEGTDIGKTHNDTMISFLTLAQKYKDLKIIAWCLFGTIIALTALHGFIISLLFY